MNDAKDRPRDGPPPPATPYLPVQTGRGHVSMTPTSTGPGWADWPGRTGPRPDRIGRTGGGFQPDSGGKVIGHDRPAGVPEIPFDPQPEPGRPASTPHGTTSVPEGSGPPSPFLRAPRIGPGFIGMRGRNTKTAGGPKGWRAPPPHQLGDPCRRQNMNSARRAAGGI